MQSRQVKLGERGSRAGLLFQYFAIGVVNGGIPATLYGFFLGYLAVPAYVYATVNVVTTLPFSFKFLFGFINDTIPIMGYRRKPYMVLGWTLCASFLLLLWCQPLPAPYWCIDPSNGQYIKEIKLPNNTTTVAPPCNANASKGGGFWAALLMCASLGYVIVDVASDGLLIEHAKTEPLERRGSLQSTAYLIRTIGMASSTIFVGLCMNGYLYNGTFSWSLSFTQICGGFAIPCILMVPLSLWTVEIPSETFLTTQEYGEKCWSLLSSKAFFFVVLYALLTTMISGVLTTAGNMVQQYWAKVGNLQAQIFSLLGNLLFSFGLYIVKSYFLHVSWRKLIIIATVALNFSDCIFTSMTTFDVVRDPYFYMGDAVSQIPKGIRFVVSGFVVVEMADESNAGLVYGLLTTASNLGQPLAQAFSNQIFSTFQPALSDKANYIQDTPHFRFVVFMSFIVSYIFTFLSLFVLWFLPRQKEQALDWKQSWPKRQSYAIATVVVMSSCLVYSLAFNTLSMLPSTMCLRIAGGNGC